MEHRHRDLEGAGTYAACGAGKDAHTSPEDLARSAAKAPLLCFTDGNLTIAWAAGWRNLLEKNRV